MKQKLVLIGGAKGVGKSTVLDELSKDFPFEIVNTGNIVKLVKNNSFNYEQIILHLISKQEGLIFDTHYAVYDGDDGFKRNKLYDLLPKIDQKRNMKLILVDSTPEIILKRRKKDVSRSRRMEFNHIKRELEKNREYFQDFCNYISTEGTVIFNNTLDQCLNNVRRYIE
ncbi:MAG: ATP-binding protein [Candidatus Thorarchaeota archaeon]